jgi:Uma2 family endonuclease
MNAAVLEVREPRAVWLDQVSARWQEVLNDPSLRDLPYKIETNRGGQLIMSPAKNVHGAYQMRVGALLKRQLAGEAIAESSIATPEGVKVADVAWCSTQFLAKHKFADPYAVAPEICVEIKSPSNAESELMAKVRLYLDAGAHEVWLVDAKGGVRIYGPEGARASSHFDVDVSEVAFDTGQETER